MKWKMKFMSVYNDGHLQECTKYLKSKMLCINNIDPCKTQLFGFYMLKLNVYLFHIIISYQRPRLYRKLGSSGLHIEIKNINI